MTALPSSESVTGTWPRSPGYFTDLRILEGFGAKITDRGTYWVIETPTNPGYYWGNFLLFRAAPAPGDYGRWMAQFAREFAHAPEVRHRVFAWDVPVAAPDEVAPFLAEGFDLQEGIVLTTSEPVPPPRPFPDLDVRPLRTDVEWEAALRNQVACRSDGFEEAEYERFKRRQMADYRAIVEAGAGAWFGAFLGDRLVGELGIFVFDGLGRFQSVGTDPAHRGRGVCGTLVYRAACHAKEHLGAERLVIVADPGDQAVRVYQSVGFVAREPLFGVCRRPLSEA